MDCAVRAMVDSDLLRVLDIQRAAYAAELHEGIDKYRARLQFCREGCYVAVDGGAAVAYVQSHAWSKAVDPPGATDEAVPAPPAQPDCWFLFDLAVSLAVRGRGVARALVDAVMRAAKEAGVGCVRLVAVGDADTFWSRLGFAALQVLPAGSGYGGQRAVLMELAI
jgi:predicted N-acetyltransferase YhbS